MADQPNRIIDVLHSAWIENSRQQVVTLSPLALAPLFCQCEKFYLVRVTAVLTARSDGTKALGQVVNGQVSPAAPYLKNPSIHKEPDSNYVTDWLKLANAQLLRSGSCFGLDINGLQYVLEPNDALYTRECGDGNAQQTTDFINAKIAAGESAYKDRVILIFRWGSDLINRTGEGCSGGVPSPNILMPGYYQEFAWLDGKPHYGNNLLTHELGHFFGLEHVFPWLANKQLEPLVAKDNDHLYPLHKNNLPNMPGVTEADLIDRKEKGLQLIATWGFSIEQDTRGDAKAGIPDQYSIQDTPMDLGVGLPLLFGDSACESVKDYPLDRYVISDLDPIKDGAGNPIGWNPKPGTKPSFVDTVSVNDTVRQNVMNYWRCDRDGQVFSDCQVKRMHFVLLTLRSSLIEKILSWSAPCWVLKFPWWVRKTVPWEGMANLFLAFWFFVLRIVTPRIWDSWRVFTGNIVQPAHRWDGVRYRQYLEDLDRTGQLQEMIEEAVKSQSCGIAAAPLPQQRQREER